jgi:Flp pilus assembly protein TadD
MSGSRATISAARRAFVTASAFSVTPLVVVIGAALLAYSGITKCGFIGMDDDLYVYENLIVSQGLTRQGVRWAFTAFFASTWQPLVWLSYMVDVTLSGVNPAAMHRTNLLLHLINIVLVYACLLQLTGHKRPAFLASLLFAVHPVHVESVAWIAGRKDLLSTPFWWAAILAYAAYAHRPSRIRYAAVIGAMLLGLMAKPMLMTLPAVLLLLDIWPLRRVSLSCTNGWKAVLLEKWPLLLPSLLSFAVALHVQAAGGSLLTIETLSLWGRFSNAAVSLWRYIGTLLWPVRLAILYPHHGGWPLPVTLAALLGLGVTFNAAWRCRHRHPGPLVALLTFAGTLVPVLGLIQFGWQAMADRFLYIPAIALYGLAAFAIDAAWQAAPRWRRPLGVAIAGVTLALIARTHDQVTRWHSSLTLFSHAVAVTEDNWMMHSGVGAALSRAGRHDEAATHFETAIRLKPDRPKAHFNLGHARFMQGRWAEAAAAFQRSIDLLPTDKARFNLAAAQARDGKLAEAEATYHILLANSPLHVPAMVALADIHRATGRHETATVIYRQALALDDGNIRAQTGLGIALLDSGKPVEALKQLVQVLQANPANPEARQAVQRAMTPDAGD